MLIPVLLLVIGLVVVGLLGSRVLAEIRTRQVLAKSGVTATAEVLELHQTGSMVNQVQVMRLRLRVEQGGEAPREVTCEHLIDLGVMPRVGDRVLVVVDPKDPRNVSYAGLASGLDAAEVKQSGLTVTQNMDLLGVGSDLRENGVLGVGTILAIAMEGALAKVTVEVDSVVEPKRVLTTEQSMSEFRYGVGDRAYLFLSPTDRNALALAPLSLTGGAKLDKALNRLDPLVLGPQLLREGRKGMGTVETCEQRSVSNVALAGMGMQKWHLRMRIVPENGEAAYEAEQDVTFTTADKVARICVVGAQVPVRYDANDRMTFSTDTVAMGYADPYAATLGALKAKMYPEPAAG